jgi:hypothetical protein
MKNHQIDSTVFIYNVSWLVLHSPHETVCINVHAKLNKQPCIISSDEAIK